MAAEPEDPRPDLIKDAKEAYFRRELNAFIDLAVIVSHTAHKSELEYGFKKIEDIPEISGPGYYKQILDHPKLDISFIYSEFEIAFGKRRKAILAGLKDLSWTIQRGYNINYGKKEELKKVHIPIDTIFTLANENLVKLEERLANIEEKLIDEGSKYELKHHILLLLHLLRLFFIVNIGKDRITLAIMVKSLEDELNVVIGERCIPVNANLGSSSTGLASGVGQAFGTISNLMRSIGINPPEGVRPPTDDQLSNIISGVFNNPTLQATVQSSMAGLNGSNNTTDVVASIMGNIIKGDVLQDITQATTSTVEQALYQPQSEQAQPPQNLETTLKNFVNSVSQSAGAASPADLINMPVHPTPGIGQQASSAPVMSSAPTVAPAPLATPQLVSSVPQHKITTLQP